MDKTLAFIQDFEDYSLILLIAAGISVVITTGIRFYIKLRPRFPARVNCWFCNKDSSVPYLNFNSWDCPHCSQYNGFSADGGYNKVIPSQSIELLNQPVITAKRSPFQTAGNVLCQKCSINQELKVQQLASFSPVDCSRYDEEVDVFRKHIEHAYQLCEECENKTQEVLSKTSGWLKKMYREQKRPIAMHKPNASTPLAIIRHAVYSVCRIGSLFVIIGLLPQLLYNFLLLSNISFPTLTCIAKYTAFDAHLCLAAALLMLFTVGSNSCCYEQVPTFLWIVAVGICSERKKQSLSWPVKYTDCAQVIVLTLAMVMSMWIHYKHFLEPSQKQQKTERKRKKSAAVKRRGNPKDAIHQDDEKIAPNPEYHPVYSKTAPEDVDYPDDFSAGTEDSLEVRKELGNLSLGSPGVSPTTLPSVFQPRVYQSCEQALFTASDLPLAGHDDPRRRKPVLSPSRLQVNSFNPSPWSTSGVWQNRSFSSPFMQGSSSLYFGQSTFQQNFTLSRSSSQSSGFVSRESKFSSLPNSRAGSVCGEADRLSVISEPACPTYAARVASYCCHSATQPILLIPSPLTNSVALSTSNVCGNLCDDKASADMIGGNEMRPKTIFSMLKDNFALSTIFVSSLVFNVVVVAYAVMHILHWQNLTPTSQK